LLRDYLLLGEQGSFDNNMSIDIANVCSTNGNNISEIINTEVANIDISISSM